MPTIIGGSLATELAVTPPPIHSPCRLESPNNHAVMRSYAYILDTPEMTVFSEDLEQYREAVWVLDPVRNRVLAANALACARFGWSPDTRMPPLILDAGMPGFVRLRFLIGEGDLSTPQTEELLLWTQNGAERILCRISRIPGNIEKLLLVEEQCGTPSSEKKPTPSQPISPTKPKAAKPKTTSTSKARAKPTKKPATAKRQPRANSKPTATATVAKKNKRSSKKSEITAQAVSKPTAGKRKTGQKSGKKTNRKTATPQPELIVPSSQPPINEEAQDAAVLQAIAKQILSGKKTNLKPLQAQSIDNGEVAKTAVEKAPACSKKPATPQNKGKRKQKKRTDDYLSVPDFNKVEQALKFSVAALRQATQISNDEGAINGVNANVPISDLTVAGLARLAHEMKTSLSAISAASEIMRDERIGPIENPRYKSYASDIHENAQHLLGVIERMLPRDNEIGSEIQRPAEFSELDFNDLTQRVISGLKPLAKERGLTLTHSAKQRLPHVVADATSVRQIIINLVNNAIKFTPAGGKITVSTGYQPNGPVKISVRDTGPGMPHAEVQKALKGQGSNTLTQRQGGGYGLGFPLVHLLAAQNGATLDIKSRLGRGTTIAVCFGKDRVIPI